MYIHTYKQIIAHERTLMWSLYMAYGSLQVLASGSSMPDISFDREERGTRLQGNEALVLWIGQLWGITV